MTPQDLDNMLASIGQKVGAAARAARTGITNAVNNAPQTFENVSRNARDMFETAKARMMNGGGLTAVCAVSALMIKGDGKIEAEEISAAVTGIKTIFEKFTNQMILAELEKQLNAITDSTNPIQRYKVVSIVKDNLPDRATQMLALEVAGSIAAADGTFDGTEADIARFLMKELGFAANEAPPSMRNMPAASSSAAAPAPAPAAAPAATAPAPKKELWS